MITSILEFKFSDHYFYDNDNRFKIRVKDAKILNIFPDMALAYSRFKRVMYDILLNKLDTMRIDNLSVGLIVGEIVFVYGGKIVPAEIQIDNGKTGNVYVVPVSDNKITTLLLFKNSTTNVEILKQLDEHNKREKRPQINKLVSITGVDIDMNASTRTKIVINLDLSDSVFYAKHRAPAFAQNLPSKYGFTELEAKKMTDDDKARATDDIVMSGTIIPDEFKKQIPEKEWGVGPGTQVWIKYPDGLKLKEIEELLIDETSNSRKYSLRFKNTQKIYPLSIGGNFIITPEQQTDTYMRLVKTFDIKLGHVFSFDGPILRFMYYPKNTKRPVTKVGIVIAPKQFY